MHSPTAYRAKPTACRHARGSQRATAVDWLLPRHSPQERAVDALAGIGGDSTVVELQPGPRNAVVGTRGRSIVVVPVADVYIAHMDGGHVQLITAKGELRSNNRLYELESTLGEGFVRISKSAIVNIDAIDRIEPGFGGALSVQMVDGSVEWISRRFLGAFKQAIGMGRA